MHCLLVSLKCFWFICVWRKVLKYHHIHVAWEMKSRIAIQVKWWDCCNSWNKRWHMMIELELLLHVWWRRTRWILAAKWNRTWGVKVQIAIEPLNCHQNWFLKSHNHWALARLRIPRHVRRSWCIMFAISTLISSYSQIDRIIKKNEMIIHQGHYRRQEPIYPWRAGSE